MKRELLFARIPPPRESKYGITAGDIARITAVPELVSELQDCLHSDDEADIIFGLMFVEFLRPRPDFCAVAESSLPALAASVRSLLAHPSVRVHANAIRCFVAFRHDFIDYAATMRAYLSSLDSPIRREALAAAPTYLSATELGALLPFRNDSDVSETGGMGGPLRYILRDFALEVAEHIAGRQFPGGDCFERRDGSTVSWRSWSSFSQWLESKKRFRLLHALSNLAGRATKSSNE